MVCWGNAGSGGDCGAVREQLTDVKAIAGNSKAFTAIRGDGPVVCWGNAGSGGDCGAVQEQLKGSALIRVCESGHVSPNLQRNNRRCMLPAPPQWPELLLEGGHVRFEDPMLPIPNFAARAHHATGSTLVPCG